LRPTRGIVHCDVTLRNILLDERGWPYLADFDLSQIVEVAQAANPIGPKYPACLIILRPETPEFLHPLGSLHK